MPKEKVTKPYVNNKEFLEHMIKYRNNVLINQTLSTIRLEKK